MINKQTNKQTNVYMSHRDDLDPIFRYLENWTYAALSLSGYKTNCHTVYLWLCCPPRMWKFHSPKRKFPQQVSWWSLEQVRTGIIGRQSSCDAGVWHTQGPHFPSKQEEQEQGYPSTISSTAVKPWEALDFDCWPEWRELEVIAASAVVWRHNL